MKKLLTIALAATVALGMTSLRAIDITTATWTGDKDGVTWNDADNWHKVAIDGWEGNQVPYPANAVIIDGNSGKFSDEAKTVVNTTALTLPVSVTLLNDAVLKVGTEDVANALNITTEGGNNRSLTGGTVICNYVEVQTDTTLTLSDSHLKTTTDRLGQVAIYQNGSAYIDIVNGESKAAKFTYLTSGVSDPYSYFFAGENPKIMLNGSAVASADDFEDYFTVTDNGDGTTTLSLNATIPSWKIAADAASSIGETSATISATVKKVGDASGVVYYICDASRSAVEAALEDASSLTATTTTAAKDATATVALTELTTETTYYYAFAIVRGGEVVATTAVSSFTPSAYDNTYANGAWSKGTPVAGQKLLIKEAVTLTYDNVQFGAITVDVGSGNQVTIANNTAIRMTGALTIKSGAIRPVEGYNTYVLEYGSLLMDGGEATTAAGSLVEKNITLNGGFLVVTGEATGDGFSLRNAKISSTTWITGNAYMVATNSHIVSDRTAADMKIAPYGIYGGSTHFDLVKVPSGGNVIDRACAFTFNYREEEDETSVSHFPRKSAEEIYNGLFANGQIVVNGANVASLEDFNAQFIVLTNTTAKTQTVTMFDTFTADGDYTLKEGAYVKLNGDVKVASLTVEAGAEIDLNGHTLKVPAKALIVDGNEIAKGAYSGDTLPTGFKNGSVEVLSGGLVLIFR